MRLLSTSLLTLCVLLGCGKDGLGGRMRFPESGEDETPSSDPGKVIDEILTASRAGRALHLTVGGKEIEEPLALSSDPQFQEVSAKDTEARSYVANKLCSLGLAKCGEQEQEEAEGRHVGNYGHGGLTNLKDVTLVQPVALRPVGEPIAAIPLQREPFGAAPISGKYMGGFGSGNFQGQETSYSPQQGGLLTNNRDCNCVPIGQCNSFDIVSHYPSGTGSQGVISGIGQPNFGNVGAGIDPRNKKAEIESNATVVDAVEASENRAISEPIKESSARRRRDAPVFDSNPRIVNGAYRGCHDDRLVCCKNPIKSHNYPSGSSYPISSSYPTNSYNPGSSNTNYNPGNSNTNYNPGNSNYNPGSSNYNPGNSNYNPTYPQRPVTNGYYPPPSSGGFASGGGTCGKRNSNGINGRVLAGNYGGNSAEFGEYPWQAALLKKDGANSIFVCGASIIDNKHLLTAAHCLKSHRPEELRVRLGEWDVNAENEFYQHVEFDVAAIAVHPEYYAGNLVNDVAIVKLTNYVDFAKYPHISPICLPQRGQDFTGKRCWATGWGKDAFGSGGKFQRILQEVDVPVINNYECEQRLRRTRLGPDFSLHKGFLCAGGEPEKDACKGDGGGPLSCEVGGVWQLAGIVSWGVGCGTYGTPGVYINTASYIDWIRQTIN